MDVAVVSAPAPAPPAGAQVAPRPHLAATRIDAGGPPVIDGKIDDAVWKKATPTSAFTQKTPNDGRAPREKTTVRVLYDDDALYVAFDCEQTQTPVVQRLTRRDRVVEADWVAFDVGTRSDGKSAFEFVVNAAGVLADGIRFNDTDYSSDWDENFDARTSLTSSGWSAEFRVPLRILRFHSRPVQSWDFQARRYVSERQETDEWAHTPRSVAGEVSHYGRLDGLVGLHAGAPLELRPFVLGRIRRRDAASGQLASGTDLGGSAGIDLKWHPTQDLTLDATFNPDFAQVEADQVVLNLTTFETYYPEKRPFFLEGIDTFATPMQLVYTRRIGRAAPSPSLRTGAPFGEQLVDVPSPATIYGASKLTGRLSDAWSIGTLQAISGRNDVDVQLADGSRVRRLVDPLSAFNVLRLKRDLGRNAHVGVLATATTHAEPTSDYPPLPPVATPGSLAPPRAGTALCPSGHDYAAGSRCFNNAYVGGIDWRWRSPEGDYTTGGQVVSSMLDHGPARQVADGTVIKPGDAGVGGVAYFSKEGGKHVVWSTQAVAKNRKLDFNDLGFNRRANALGVGAGLEYRELDPFWTMLEAHARLDVGANWNLDGLNIERGIYASSFGKLTNFWTYYTDLHYKTARFDDREMGDGAALERAGLFGHDIGFGTDPTKRVFFLIDVNAEVLSNGVNITSNARLTTRVLPQFDIDLIPTAVYTSGEPRYVAAGPTPGQYLFGKLEAKSVGATVRATYTFTPRLTLQTYAQLFLASGHYDQFSSFQSDPAAPRPAVRLADLQPFAGGRAPATNPDFQEGVLNVNVVVRWEYMLGSTLFLVYTRAQVPSVTLAPGEAAALSVGAVNRAPAQDVLLLKVSYWWG